MWKKIALALLILVLGTLCPGGGSGAALAADSYEVIEIFDFEDEDVCKKHLRYDEKAWQRVEPASGEQSPGSGGWCFKYAPNASGSTALSSTGSTYWLVPATGNPALSFWVYNASGSSLELSASIDDRVSWHELLAIPSPAAGGWTQYQLDISGWAGLRVAWKLELSADPGTVAYVDDVALVNMKLPPVKLGYTSGGWYDGSKLTLSCDDPRLTLRYTTDGTMPDLATNGSSYTAAFTRAADSTIIARAYDATDTSGQTAGAVKRWQLGKPGCAPVTLTRLTTATGATLLVMSCTTRDAKIYYARYPLNHFDDTDFLNDGTKKTYDDQNPIEVKESGVYYFWAEKEGLSPSAVQGIRLRLGRSAAVTASVDDRYPVPQGTRVTLLCKDDPKAEIYYTLDGSAPIPEKNGYRYTTPLVIEQDTLLTARSFRAGLEPGPLAVFNYKLDRSGDIFEPNNELKYATVLGFPARIEASLAPAHFDVDYYAFDFPADGHANLRLQAADERRKEFSLTLYNATGAALAVTPSDCAPAIAQEHLKAGRYYVKVDGSYGEYSLTLTRQGADMLDLSENHMLLHSLHPDSPYAIYPYGLNSGGHYMMSTAYLARWQGPVLEKDDPYEPEYVKGTRNPDTAKMLPKDVPARYHIQDILWLPTRDHALDNEHLKSALYAYGAIDIGFFCDFDYFMGKNEEYYYYPLDERRPEGGGHAVTLVGWNDEMSRSKFTTPEGYTPAVDGAFILKNSWGRGWGNDGYFYVSYDCKHFPQANRPMLVLGAESTENYDLLYQYDEFGLSETYDCGRETIYAKNVFTASADCTLEAVSFYTAQQDTAYDILLQVGDEAPRLVASGSKQYCGYYTQRLAKAVPVASGATFAVILRSTVAPGRIAATAVERPFDDYAYKAGAESGQSFISADGVDENWTDIGETIKGNNCIKVMARRLEPAATSVAAEPAAAPLPLRMRKSTPPEAADDPFTGPPALGSAIAPLPAETAAGPAPLISLPEGFDLRTIGAVTPAKDQGNIGSCWTFATMGSLESTLLRNNNQGFSYPLSIAVEAPPAPVRLEEGVKAVEVSATATVRPDNIGTGLVCWTFTGDLDSIEILTRQSQSGINTPLFTALQPGRITATATSAADTQKQASFEIDIYRAGDVDGDGCVTVYDALLALRFARGLETDPTPEQLRAACLSGSGDGTKITEEDVRCILKRSKHCCL